MAVTLLFVPFYALAAVGAGRWVFRRFSTEERAARLVALTTASLAVSLLGILFLRLWGAVWETIRLEMAISAPASGPRRPRNGLVRYSMSS